MERGIGNSYLMLYMVTMRGHEFYRFKLHTFNPAIVATLRCRCATAEFLFGIKVVCHPEVRGIFGLQCRRVLQKV